MTATFSILENSQQNTLESTEQDIHKKPDSEFDPTLVEALQGKYTLERMIGEGAQGKIYKGTCQADGKPVAIKQLCITTAENWKQYELFEREAKVLNSISVPGTAKFYEAIQNLETANPFSIIIQEYINGQSLQSYLNNGNRFMFEHVCQILIKILDIIKTLHQHKPPIIHRDIKPSNIILKYSDKPNQPIPDVYIVDFGAVANPQVQDGGSTVTGTYGYMAPEQLIGKPTAASDIYSFAVMAVYLLSGTPPENIAVQDLRLIIEPHLMHLPYEVTAFLKMMLEKAPHKRLMDYGRIRNTLERFSNHQFKIDFNTSTHSDTSTQIYCTIEDFKSIDQCGNFAIWLDLPDATPRKVDKLYQTMAKIDNQVLLHSKECDIQSREIYPERDHYDLKFKSLRTLQFSIVAIMILCFIFYSSQYTILFASTDKFSDTFLRYLFVDNVMIFIAITSILLIFLLSLRYCRKSQSYKQIMLLLKYGKKSIATIRNIEFQSSISSNTVIDCPPDTDTMTNLNREYRPLWKVIYVFNLPDDDNLNTLQHVYYSDVPVVHLKPGDTLPILYFIYPDMLDQNTKKYQNLSQSEQQQVWSMPYPLPIDGSFLQCSNCCEVK